MEYTPITEPFKQKFGEGLCADFPEYFHPQIAHWLSEVANELHPFPRQINYGTGGNFNFFINSPLASEAQNAIRCVIPKKHLDFFSNRDLCIEVLNFVAQKCSKVLYLSNEYIQRLENILCMGGHAYKVAYMGTEQIGLIKRVSDELEDVSAEALSESDLLREAWHCLYKKDPDFEGAVAKSIDALETKIKQKYYPDDPKPSLGKFLNQMKNDVQVRYAGNVVDTNRKLFEVCSRFANFRGQHTSGDGKIPTEEDVRFILHTSILLYDMI